MSSNTVHDDWASDYIEPETESCYTRVQSSTVHAATLNVIPPDLPPEKLFSQLPGPVFNDLVKINDGQIDVELDNIVDLTRPDIEIPGCSFTILNYMSHIIEYLHRKFRALPNADSDVDDETYKIIHRILVALVRYTSHMCTVYNQTPIEHPHKLDGDTVKLVRSSYKFCENSASCRVPKCRQHHFVFSRLYGDLLSLQNYITHDTGDWSINEASRSVNTIYFVITHMQHEQDALRTINVYNRAITSSYNLQNSSKKGHVEQRLHSTEPETLQKEDGDWTQVLHRKARK